MSQQPPPQQAPYGPPQWGQQASSPNGQMPYGQPPPQSLQRQYPSVQAQWGEQRSPSSLSRSVSVGNQLPQQQPPPWMVPQQPPFPPPSPSYTNPQGHQDDSRSENKKHGRGRTIALVCALLVAVVLLGYGLTVAVQRFSGSKPSVSPTVQRAVASPTTAAPLSLTATPPHKLKPSKVVVILSKADFSPALLTIAVGSTVIWKNTSPVAHTVTSDNGTFDSGDLPTGGTFRFTFKTAGTFHYFCAYHSWMTGTITVQQTWACRGHLLDTPVILLPGTSWITRKPKAQVKIPPKEQASNASKDAMIAALRKRIKEQEAQIHEPKQQVEVAYGLLAQQSVSVSMENRKGM